MTFSNIQVELAELPEARAVELTPVEPAHAKINAAVTAAVFAALAVGSATLHVITGPPVPVLLAASAAALCMGTLATTYAYLHARSIHYALRMHDLVLHKGVFFFSQSVQPLARVQHVEVKRGPLQKRYGLASLKVFSAGSGKETFTVPGLALDDAERIRDRVLDHRP